MRFDLYIECSALYTVFGFVPALSSILVLSTFVTHMKVSIIRSQRSRWPKRSDLPSRVAVLRAAVSRIVSTVGGQGFGRVGRFDIGCSVAVRALQVSWWARRRDDEVLIP